MKFKDTNATKCYGKLAQYLVLKIKNKNNCFFIPLVLSIVYLFLYRLLSINVYNRYKLLQIDRLRTSMEEQCYTNLSLLNIKRYVIVNKYFFRNGTE